MQPQSVSVTGVADSNWLPVDYHRDPVSIGLGLYLTGTATFTVEVTYDNLLGTPAEAAAARPLPAKVTLTDLSASAAGSIDAPITGLRLSVTAGTGTVEMIAIQAGIRGG